MPVRLNDLPDRKSEYKISVPRLDGGLNLWELDYRMDNNQSPDMQNLVWLNGGLSCRDGQSWVWPVSLGAGCAAFGGLFHGRAFMHIGSCLYSCNPYLEAAEPQLLADLAALYPGWEPSRGSFFLYGGRLYYKAEGVYAEISFSEGSFSCVKVNPYTPIIMINADPATGTGDLHQPENRYSEKKTVWYTADGTALYKLPVSDIESIDSVIVNGESKNEGIDYTVNPHAGTVSFFSPPGAGADNNVAITWSKSNPEYLSSIMTCRYAEVYGGETGLCIVLGGCRAQPNAYFWNGGNAAMDPGYFPAEHYNLAGDASEEITGFGKQQDYLVIFKERSVGRALLGLRQIDGGST
jgi:hypothetical protein